MPIYNFDSHQEFISIDKLPDHRSDTEKLNSGLSLYDHNSEDLAWAERNAEELINISGAWITVQKRKRNEGAGDQVWEEDADPIYKNGIKLKGKFVPQPAEATLTRYGVDVDNRVTLHFSRANVLQLFGREMIVEGDLLIIPHNTLSVTQSTDIRDGPGNRIDRFKVLKSCDAGIFKYRWLYWMVVAQNITGDVTIDSELSGRA